MKANLLATKFHHPPLQPKRVARPHLVRRLNEGLAAGRPLTLISAPAGFGKTTCASEWLHQLDLPVAWLSLDKADDDPLRFFTYFVAALQGVDEAVGREVEGVLRAGQLPPPEALIAALVNDILGVGRRFVLALDDFHVIQDASILNVLEKLIANQPPQLHLAFVTREDPLLPLARLRANNLVTEVRSGDLRFSAEEVERFLKDVMGLSLTQADILALETRTEGWAAGLQLAGLSMQGREDLPSFVANLSGSNRYILSYLIEEVLSGQPEEVQRFLLQTSILDKLNGELCDALTGRTDSAELLERLLSMNLFLIPLDDEQRWYRYHHLFADLLRNQSSKLAAGEIAELQRRASRWYESAGMPGEAIEHALAAEDHPHAVALLEEHAMRLISRGHARRVENWMQAIPVDWHSQRPRANLAFAWMYLLRGHYREVGPYLHAAQEALSAELQGDGEGLMDPRRAQDLLAESNALESNLLHVQGKYAESIQAAERALQLAQPQDQNVRGLAHLGLGGAYRQGGDYSRSKEAYLQAIHSSRAAGNLVSEMLAVSALTLMSIQHGELHFAFEIGSQGLERIERAGYLSAPIAGAVYGALGLIDYQWNELERARHHLQRGMHLSTLSGHNASLIYMRVDLSRMLQGEGQLEAAAAAIEEAAGMLQTGAPAWLMPEVVAQQVRIYLAQERPALAEAALEPHLDLARPGHYIGELVLLSGLRLRLHTGEDLPGAVELARELAEAALQGQRKGIALQAYVLRARLQHSLGDDDAAQDDLGRALALAETEGFVRAFVDEGQEIRALLSQRLAQAGKQGAARLSFVRGVLAAFPQVQEKSQQPSGEDALVEPLTERELEVLELMAQGLTYGEIAERLFVTLNTVRYHVKGLYGKLNANNRTQAIETARSLGLL